MDKKNRHQIILKEVNIHNRVLLNDLSDILGVSMDTVRRDVKKLDNEKKLKKVHGGAVSIGFNNYSYSEELIYEQQIKNKIAQKSIELLNDGDVVLISGGSTNLEVIRLIPNKLNLTFFTPSLPMAVELSNNSSAKCEIFIIGGKLSRNSQLATGGSSIDILSNITADICFLGTGYIDSTNGITEVDWEIAQMKKAMIKASKKVVSLAISEKFNTSNRFKICDIDAIDVFVTELDPTSSILKEYQRNGIKII